VDKEADLLAQAAIVHSSQDVLLHLIVVSSPQGRAVHAIPTVEPIVALTTLGKLYPEDVVLLPEDGALGQTEKAGKGFEPRFILWGGVKHDGFKGCFDPGMFIQVRYCIEIVSRCEQVGGSLNGASQRRCKYDTRILETWKLLLELFALSPTGFCKERISNMRGIL